jgi:general secretion pathway protein L
MSLISKVRERTSLWIDNVATAMLAWREALRPPRFARIVEQEDGSFALQPTSQGFPTQAPARAAIAKLDWRPKPAPEPLRKPFRITGSAIAPEEAALLEPCLAHARVELVLRPERFLFRPLQLPRRAAEFLEAIVRSQIDRLTPWSAAEAAFGFQPEPQAAGDRMTVVVAATARVLLTPFVDAIRALGAASVSVSTPSPDGGAEAIKVLEQNTRGAVEGQRLRRGLAVSLAALGCLAATAIMVASIAGSEFETRRDEINRHIAMRRAELRQTGDPNSAAALALQQKKHDTPAAVIVYEELSRILPDDAYLTELRLQGDKVQIIGVARDAPDLIRIIEQSPHFKAATFFAPTTRSRSDPGQHFSIEAQIQPVFSSPGDSGQ